MKKRNNGLVLKWRVYFEWRGPPRKRDTTMRVVEAKTAAEAADAGTSMAFATYWWVRFVEPTPATRRLLQKEGKPVTKLEWNAW